MKCPRCDFRLKTGSLYCGRCGLARPRDENAVDPLLGATLGSRYRVERRIGAGGMGTVYRGIDVRLSQPVAIKVLHERFTRDPQILPRFENEALACGRLIHPNLVTLHDYGQDKGLAYAVMEYCPGISLSHLVRRHERLSAPLAVDLVVQVAQALQVVHEGDVVHRDLKPDNILLVEVRPNRYHVKLLDFGIAKYLNEEGPGLTQAGMVFGTPEYMAPEQAKGEPVDPRADIYALGVILFELLAGQVPFSGKNRMNLMHQHAHDTPPELDAVAPVPLPHDLSEVVMSCLAKDPEERPQTALELIDLLEEALVASGEAPALLTPEPIGQVTPRQGPSVIMSPPPTRVSRMSLAPASHWDLPGKGALAGAAAVLCVVIGAAAWIGGPATSAERHAPAASTQAAGPAQATPSPEPAPGVASPAPQGPGDLLVWMPEGESSASKQQPAQAPDPAVKSAPKQAIAKAPEPAPSKATPKPAPPKPAPPKVVKKGPTPEEIAANKRKLAEGQAQRLIADARKMLKHGKFDEASKAIRQAQKAAPELAEIAAFQDQLTQARDGLSLGRQLFEDGDCARAVKTLKPVLEIAPGAPGVGHIINSCRQAMPPRKL